MIVIVEPHPDDVLLSCSHLLATDAPKLIVSVGKNDSAGSARLADWYPGVQAVAFNLPNIPWKDKSDANEVKKAADPLSFVREKATCPPRLCRDVRSGSFGAPDVFAEHRRLRPRWTLPSILHPRAGSL